MVEIDVEECHAALVTSRALDEPWQQLLQIHTVWKSGEHVAPSESRELALVIERLPLSNGMGPPTTVHQRDQQHRKQRESDQQCNEDACNHPLDQTEPRV